MCVCVCGCVCGCAHTSGHTRVGLAVGMQEDVERKVARRPRWLALEPQAEFKGTWNGSARSLADGRGREPSGGRGEALTCRDGKLQRPVIARVPGGGAEVEGAPDPPRLDGNAPGKEAGHSLLSSRLSFP